MMLIPGIVASNFMNWLKRSYNYVKGFTFTTNPPSGILRSDFVPAGYNEKSDTLMVSNDGLAVAFLARNAGDIQSYYIRMDLITAGQIFDADALTAHISTLPSDSVYLYNNPMSSLLFDGDFVHAIMRRTGDNSFVVCQLDCSGATAVVTELFDVNYWALNYSIDGSHAYVTDSGRAGGNFDIYQLSAPYDWSSPTLIESGTFQISDVGDIKVSQDGKYILAVDTGTFQGELALKTYQTATDYSLTSLITPANITNNLNNINEIYSNSDGYFDFEPHLSPNGKWIISKTDYDLAIRMFVYRIDHYLDYEDAVNPPDLSGAATLNITELNGIDQYYSFASALTADRIVMDVFPLTGNGGLPTGVPAVTDEVFQTLDFTLTGGSIQDIGRNGATYFDGWIKNVKVYNGATLIADCALDETMASGTATDTSGNGNDLTANNFVAASTVAYTHDGTAYAGPEMITPFILANPYLAETEWTYNSGTEEWTLTGGGTRKLLEFYDELDQPSYFKITATVTNSNGEAMNWVISATGGEFTNTDGTFTFYARKASVNRQSFHRRVNGVNVNATLSDISFKAYLSTTTPL